MTLPVAEEAFHQLVDVVTALDEADLDRPSNLDGWTVRDVVAHVTGSLDKVRALGVDEPVREFRSDPADWRSDDPAGSLARHAEAALSALAGADLTAPRMRRGEQVTLQQAVAFPVVDAMVHAWDIRRSLGRSLELSPSMLAYADALTERAVTSGNPNFAPPVEPAADATATDRLMSRLGRTVEAR